MYRDQLFRRTAFTSFVGVPPYFKTGMRMKSGLKTTAFYPVLEPYMTEVKLHNTYLKPDQISDPVEEYWALREVAGLWDVTGEEVIEISGPGAEELVDKLVPRNMSKVKDGWCVFAIMCYEYGGIVEDAILVRFNSERFWWVGGPGWAEQWIFSKSVGTKVKIVSLLDEIHVASIQGPKSRTILQQVTDFDLDGLAYFGMVQAMVCGVPVTITRTGFTAELGYDLYVSVEDGEKMFRGLWKTGKPSGMKLCGSRALNIRRTEASILNFGQDFDWSHNPYEIGLGRMVDLNKSFFYGQEALKKMADDPIERCIVGLEVSADYAVEHGASVRYEKQTVGRISSALMSPALSKSIAISMVPPAITKLGTSVEIESQGALLDAKIVPMPFFDPERRLSK